MKRNSKRGIYTNGTVRYVGNNKYSTRGIFECKTRHGLGHEYIVKAENVQYCLRCGGSKFSCKALPHEMNQYGKKSSYKPPKEKVLFWSYLDDIYY